MKYINSFIMLTTISISSCYSSIPKQDSNHNNCLAIKINCVVKYRSGLTNSIYFTDVFFTDSLGNLYPAKSYSNDGYYYLFNIKPGIYSVDHAIIERHGSVKHRNNYSLEHDTLITFNFDKTSFETTKSNINQNEFKFIGVLNTNFFRQELTGFEINNDHNYYKTYNVVTIGITNDKKTLINNYEYMIDNIYDQEWKKLLSKEHDDLK